ncbi:MAG: hypothetical protein QF464_11300, partial [Myxococcota bacterium]|nr:hypothetical protein [Myxococcota bacterium]
LCTVEDVCLDGVCQTGVPRDCDDADPCTANSCFPGDGECETKSQLDGTGCEDGSACTELDTCIEGLCTSGIEAACDDA